jgi:hypothetical protein
MPPTVKQLQLLRFYHAEKEGLATQQKFFDELNADIKNFCEFRANNIFHCIEQHEQYVTQIFHCIFVTSCACTTTSCTPSSSALRLPAKILNVRCWVWRNCACSRKPVSSR